MKSAAAIAIIALVASLPCRARAVEQLLPGRMLTMRAAASGSQRTLFVGRSSAIVAPTPGGPDDPTVVGATLALRAASGESAAFDLPASNWSVNAAYPNELERPLLFTLIQMLWDRSDPNGYAHHITSDPLPNTPPHKILVHEAFGDHQVANVATEVEARTLGLSIYQPALAPGRHTDVHPYFGIPAIPSFPFDGSAMVVWDSGVPPPPITNTPPTAGSDPHGKPRSQATARQQKSEFLKANGAVVDVCGGNPCLAP
ncbi:MAG: hypothetical protein E6J70_13435 [Deltaproteobacteria bacterium]|nr:MAG: hypothetical protein E6J70_13435 [Deltaproteobacteria bacterium]